MPLPAGKQKRTMQAIEHGWKPTKPGLRDISPATAKRILGEGEGGKGKPYAKGSNVHGKSRK